MKRLNQKTMKLDQVKKKRIPRKLKKELKKKFKHRYNINWLSCHNVIVEYMWFYHNAFKWNMNESLVYKDKNGNRSIFKK